MDISWTILALWSFGELAMCAVGLFGSILTWRACRLPELWRSSAYYIVGIVALLDALNVTFMLLDDVLPPLLLHWFGGIVPPLAYCQVVESANDLVQRASIAGQFVLAANRFLSVFVPLKYRVLDAGRRVWSVALWLLAVPSVVLVVMQV